eukprot:CAMPEP_0196652746 /NCGR_PEP_ID=MMETSP1086-20130531/2157_1 /TAXON_ID=77921 /ORGANISM="Cyanoptyche  gloeocystis , Strain SAG4.97" /LENGTH=93 /DNA_ID=CAMNT_0041983487 /DNA_START=556 /DNA_END=833 /DNA_ORIENTATION=-
MRGHLARALVTQGLFEGHGLPRRARTPSAASIGAAGGGASTTAHASPPGVGVGVRVGAGAGSDRIGAGERPSVAVVAVTALSRKCSEGGGSPW